MVIHLIVMAGFALAGISSLLFVFDMLNPVYWITLTGMGLYMGYIPYNCVLFERFIATFRFTGNVGFLIYIADSFGYLGSVGVILTKAILGANNIPLQWTAMYSNSVMILSVFGIAGTILSMIYFRKKAVRQQRVD